VTPAQSEKPRAAHQRRTGPSEIKVLLVRAQWVAVYERYVWDGFTLVSKYTATLDQKAAFARYHLRVLVADSTWNGGLMSIELPICKHNTVESCKTLAALCGFHASAIKDGKPCGRVRYTRLCISSRTAQAIAQVAVAAESLLLAINS
jgi:hypothetical protein